MVQSLETYLRIGQPIQVITEDGFLAPYEIQKRDLVGRSSGFGPQTEKTYTDCLERIPGELFNPSDFKKKSQKGIFHLGLNMDFMEKVVLSSVEQDYIYTRLAAEMGSEMRGEPNPFGENWAELEDWQRQTILNKLPPRKVSITWETMKSIRFACQSDCIGLRQRTPWANENTPTLYEIKFNPSGELGLDIYLKRPTDKEVRFAIKEYRIRKKNQYLFL